MNNQPRYEIRLGIRNSCNDESYATYQTKQDAMIDFEVLCDILSESPENYKDIIMIDMIAVKTVEIFKIK